MKNAVAQYNRMHEGNRLIFEVLSNPDPVEWDTFVSGSPYGHYMQSHAWGVFQSQSGWEPHYLLWRDSNGICAAALLLARTVPLIATRIFYAPCGPVLDVGDRLATETVLKDLKIYVSEKNGIFLRMEPYVNAETCASESGIMRGAINVPRDWSYWNAPKLVLWLDLQRTEDEIFKKMTSTCRNEVRRGYRNGVEFTLGTDADLGEFCRLMTVTGQHKGIAVHDPDYYRRLFNVVNASAHLQLFLGSFEGNIVTAGVSVKYGNKAWLLYAASTPDSYKLRANRTLQWEMIKWAHAAGCERYDFRGTATNDPPSPDDPGYGVYEFKKSFGPEYVRLAGYFDLVNRSMLYRMFRATEEHVLPTAYRVRTWLGERGKR